jgi:Beta-propeller repeat
VLNRLSGVSRQGLLIDAAKTPCYTRAIASHFGYHLASKVGQAMFIYSAIAQQKSLLIVGVLLLLASCNISSESVAIDPLALKVGYTRQFGTLYGDEPTSITTDANGNVYIAGNTGSASGVVDNAYIYKYDTSGSLLWSIKGAACCNQSYWYTYANGITTDATGNVYVTGSVTDYHRTYYVYVDKYDASGNLVWTKKFRETNTNPSADPTHMRSNAIATDAKGYIYVMFSKYYYPYQYHDVYIRKYKPSGGLLWEKEIGYMSSYTSPATLTTDARGNVYTALASVYDYRETNTLISKYDTQGNFLWSKFINPSGVYQRTNVHSIKTDAAGNVYIAGITDGSLEGTNQGFLDAYVRKYDLSGNVLWTRQFGTSFADWANSITNDASGTIYVAGSTQGSLQTNVTNKGEYDAYVRKYDSNGNVFETRQFGTSSFDAAYAVTTASGTIYVAGGTRGSLQGTNKGGLDAYVRKYTP